MKNAVDPSLLPQMSLAKARYPLVLQALMDYEQHVDSQGDEALDEYRALQRRLEVLVEKDLSTYNLWNWWEEEGIEVLAFRVALPDPPRLERRLRSDEVTEIVRRLYDPAQAEAANEFAQQFSIYLDDWNHRLLKLNAPCYQRAWFLRQKDAQGQWFEYSTKELEERLMGSCNKP